MIVRKVKYFFSWIVSRRKRIMSTAFIFGFVLDYTTLTRIDLAYNNAVLLVHITIVSLGIIATHYYQNKHVSWRFLKRIIDILPIVIQFSFGGLLSAFLVFYFRSATLVASWPFVLLLVGLLIGNEFFEKKYHHLAFQLGIFYFILFSYFIFSIPILLHRVGSDVFLLSGFVSLLVMSGYVYFLHFINSRRSDFNISSLAWSIGGIFSTIIILYFLNIIPPIPLSLQDVGVYHQVMRAGNTYSGVEEMRRWYDYMRLRNRIRIIPGDPVYVWSTVFVPTGIVVNAVHHWQYFNEESNSWVDWNRVSFPLVGGRDGGYRGFSLIENAHAGLWRVDIETPNGLLIGRETFYIEHVDERPKTIVREL